MIIYELPVKTKMKLIKNPDIIQDDDIALIFSGHMRTFKKTIPTTIEKLKEHKQVHVYLHTWSCLDIGMEDNEGLIEGIMETTSGANLCGVHISKPINDNHHTELSSHFYMYYSMWMAQN